MVWLEKPFLCHLNRFTYLQARCDPVCPERTFQRWLCILKTNINEHLHKNREVEKWPLREWIMVERERPGWSSLSLLVLWLIDPLASSSWDAKCAVWGRWIHSTGNLFSSVAASSNNKWRVTQLPSEEYTSCVDLRVPKSFWATSSASCKAPEVN